MEGFCDLYDPFYACGSGEAGFQEGSGDMMTDILLGRNADAVKNMSRA